MAIQISHNINIEMKNLHKGFNLIFKMDFFFHNYQLMERENFIKVKLNGVDENVTKVL